jgi:hypothetical protein
MLPNSSLFYLHFYISLYFNTFAHTVQRYAYIECSECRLIGYAGSFWKRLIVLHCRIPGKQKVIHSVITQSSESVSVMPSTVTEVSFCYALFCVFMAHVRYNLEQRVFIYDCYVGKNSYKSCKTKLCLKFPDTTCLSGDKISYLEKKVGICGILIDSR